MVDWLAEAGASVPEEVETCAILYFTRFYRLWREGQARAAAAAAHSSTATSAI